MKKYSYIGISFVILIFGIIFFPKIMDRIDSKSISQTTRLAKSDDLSFIKLNGEKKLESIVVKHLDIEKTIDTDYFIPLFGLIPKLGSISNWGLELNKNSIIVNNSLDYQTNIPGVFAIGDINSYPGKLKLILCGFHEATIMCHSALKIIKPNKKNILKYTTVSGVQGFDGSIKKTDNSIIKTIN